QPTNSSGNSRNEIMENTLRSYYLYIEQKDIDSAIGCFTAAKQRSIKRNVLTTIAKDTEHFYIDKMNILANRGNTSKILIALYHKKYGNPLELWEVTAELAEEGGEWKIADIQGRKIK